MTTMIRTISRAGRFCLAVAAVACGLSAGVAVRAAPPIATETLAENLNWPRAIAFLPNGDALIAEQDGRVLVLRDGRILDTPIKNTPTVFVTQLGGMADIIADPGFAETGEVFFSYTQGAGPPWSLVLAKAKLVDGALQNVRTIFEVKATNKDEKVWGGHLVFWRDGTLLMSMSDGGDTRAQAQRTDSLLGKVLRLDKEGRVPADNPFVSSPGKRPEIFSLGHRHAIGLLYDSIQDLIYANENGPYGGDEINVLKPGLNYGWPIATYGMDYSGAYISPFQEYPGMEPPILHWTPSIAPSGMTQCRKCQWPEWEGDLFSGALSGKKMMRVKVDGSRVIEQESMLVELGARIRDVQFGPDGALYVLTDAAQARLLKLTRGPGG